MRVHLSETENIKSACRALDYLLNRPVAHQPGLGMIYGAPGLGKTQFSQRAALSGHYIYLSAKKADTAKSFIAEVTKLLLQRYHPRETGGGSGTRSALFYRCLDILNENTMPNHLPLLFIDEVDNIVHEKHEGIVGMLRDIVDNSAAIVILVGMQDLRSKIVKLNAHYYNRVVYFCEFKPLSYADTKLLVKDLSEVSLAADLLTSIHSQAKGDARKVIKYIRHYEELAGAHGQSHLDEADAKRLLRVELAEPRTKSLFTAVTGAE
ncbi:MAG: ATP-binding protein [Candidatus Cloacimonadaceae bacterium]|nr:ATP-binding protein [Candidatus Cloacimonadaceae bacterium]